MTDPASSSMYQIYSDGGARGNPGPAAAGFLIKDGSGQVVAKGGQYLGQTTNNVAEYAGVALALNHLVVIEKVPPNAQIDCYLDSLLVAQQLSGRYKIKQAHLLEKAQAIFELIHQHQLKVSYHHIPREQNQGADALVNQILDHHTAEAQ